jgi:hypothetical protein
MPDQAFDPFRILAALRAHGVHYVLVGGLAAVAQGSPAGTDDVDICVDGDDVNLKRLGLALEDVGATQKPIPPGEEHRVSFRTLAGGLDCLEPPPGSPGFGELASRAVEMDLGQGVVARVASVDDLVEMKRAAGDLAAAAHIAALKAPEIEVPEAPAPARRHVRKTSSKLDALPQQGTGSSTVITELRETANPLDVPDFHEPEGDRRRDRVWKKLEEVDRFMTRLTEGKPRDL